MESYLGELKKQLQCFLCNDTLIEPKLVDCFHVFCKLCIKRNAEVDQEEVIFKCPQCESKTLLQDLNDVEDLQISPVHARILKGLELIENQKICSVSSSHPEALWHCLDCEKSLCEECLHNHSQFIKNHEVVSLSDLRKEDIDKLLKREPLCKTHDNQSVELYCQDCDMLICLLCLKDDHQNHKTKAMQDIIAVEINSVSKNLEQIDKMTTDEMEKKQQEEICLIIERDGEKATKQVKELAEKLMKTIRNNEQQLLDQIRESTAKAKRNLRIINHNTQAQEYIKFFIENGTVSEMMDIRHDKSSQNITDYCPFDKTIGGIEFKPNEHLCEQVEHGLGLVNSPLKKTTDPMMSPIKVELDAMKEAELMVEFKSSEEQLSHERLENVAMQLTPEDELKVDELQMTEDSDNAVHFVPAVPGQLTADTKLHGNPACNRPLAKSQKSTKMALNTGFEDIRGIAVNKTNSKIAVADFSSHCVKVFKMQGYLLLTYGRLGSGREQLNCPHGLAFLNETDLVIADHKNHRICTVNTSTGVMVRAFGRKGTSNGQFTNPCGVYVDDDENIIVCDMWNHRVQVFRKNGQYLYQFSIPGKPYSVVKHNGLFYVSDNAVVHVIRMKDNQSPTIVSTIDSLQCPRGLALDNYNNLLICDNDLIHKFSLDGRRMGQSNQLFDTSYYIAVLNDDQVIVNFFEGMVGCVF